MLYHCAREGTSPPRSKHSASPPRTEATEPNRMRRQRYRQQDADARSPSRQLMALHRLADKTALIVASDNPAYSDVWNAASKLSRSRRVYGTASDPVAQSRHPSSRENTMRVDMAEETDSGRRMSNAGIELGDWINKYQKSDHHSDRLVRTIVQYEQTTGQRFPGTVYSIDCFYNSLEMDFVHFHLHERSSTSRTHCQCDCRLTDTSEL